MRVRIVQVINNFEEAVPGDLKDCSPFIIRGKQSKKTIVQFILMYT
jgi:hypothetical protein